MTRPACLVVRIGALGDLLLLRPAIEGLVAAGFDVTLLGPEAAGALLARTGLVRLLPWESLNVAALLANPHACPPELDRELRSMSAALAITNSEALLEALRARVARVVALPPEPPPGVHAAHWCTQGAAALGATGPPTPRTLSPSPEDDAAGLEWARRLPHGFLALHPGSGSATKNWAPNGFAAVAEALAPGTALALIGGPADDDAVAALARLLPRAVRLQRLPLPVLGAVLSRAALYVGNDSGVSHLAAAFGAPTLALFGRTDPVVWGPLGPHVVTLRAARGELALLEAGPVIAAALRLRSAAPARPVG